MTKKINSKAKGKRGELEWSHFCQRHGFQTRRTAQFCGNTGDASDCVGLPGIHQEVKRVEKLNLDAAMDQSEHDAKASGNPVLPVVAHRKNYGPWNVTMRAEDWFLLYRAYLSAILQPTQTTHTPPMKRKDPEI